MLKECGGGGLTASGFQEVSQCIFRVDSRRMSGKHAHSGEKRVIAKVRAYFDQKIGGISEDGKSSLKRTAEAVGRSPATVKRICKEFRETNTFKSPKKVGKGRRPVVFDEFLQGVIRRVMMDFYLRKEFPTIKRVLAHLKENVPRFPDVSPTTLYRRIRKMGFKYRKFHKKSVLMESPEMMGMRNTFLRQIRHLRHRGWSIYYTDESWCGANHSRKYGWQDQVTDISLCGFNSYRDVPVVNGWRGGIKTPSGAGKRVILLHIGNEDGFLEGGLKCFIGKKGGSDYHDEMNKTHYEEWFRDVLARLPQKSAVVIDRAPYHTMTTDKSKNPTMAWRKDRIIEWLENHHVPFPDQTTRNWKDFTKPLLLTIAKPFFQPKEYLLEKVIRDSGKEVKLLWLPVAHCELNAIELIWAYVKNAVAKENKTFNIKTVLELCRSQLCGVPQHVWANSVRHVQKLEDYYWEKDRICEERVEELIIPIGNDSSSSEEFSDSDSETEYAEIQSDSDNGC
jgi:transposase